jgi:hypothetical protein
MATMVAIGFLFVSGEKRGKIFTFFLKKAKITY